jgi:hypothetical protein
MASRLAIFLLLTHVPIRAEAQCIGIPVLPSPLLFYADGKTISFETEQSPGRAGSAWFKFDVMRGVMTLGCQFGKNEPWVRPSKIELAFDKGKICLGDMIIMKGQSCRVEAINDLTLGELPEVKWAARIEKDGSIERSAPGWMLGYPDKK